MHTSQPPEADQEQELLAQKSVLAWHGFGSPVGLAILIFSSGAAALMWRLALFGWGNS